MWWYADDIINFPSNHPMHSSEPNDFGVPLDHEVMRLCGGGDPDNAATTKTPPSTTTIPTSIMQDMALTLILTIRTNSISHPKWTSTPKNKQSTYLLFKDRVKRFLQTR